MTTQIIRTNKFVISLCVFAPLLFLSKLAYAASLADDVNNLAETAKSTADSFVQNSFDLRLKYQYNGCELNGPDRKNLYDLAARAGDELQTIAKVQESLKNKIETYQGADWDDKYGKTGLWRKLALDLNITTLYSCGADYYRAIAAEPDEKNKILLDILTRIDAIDKALNSPDVKLLKAKATAQLARTELAYKPSVIYLLNSLAADRDIPEPIRFRAVIEKINFFGNSEDNDIGKLLNKLDASSCRDDLELVLIFAFFQQQKDPATFETVIKNWPQTQDYIAPVILDNVFNKLSDGNSLTEISTFDAELAVLAAWKNNAQNYTPLLGKLASIKKFQTPIVLYVTGLAYTEASPEKSIKLLTQASKLQQSYKSSRLDIEPEKIAEQAAKFAYNFFLSDASACSIVLDAFQNYSTMAADKVNIQLEYLHTLVLNQCGQPQRATDLLKKIAAAGDAGPAEIWRKRAAFDLILQTLSQSTAEDAARKSTIEQLALLIDDCPADSNEFSQLRTEAITIYCQLLLENNNSASAQKILEALRYSQPYQPTLILLKSKALLQLNKPYESAQTLLDIKDTNDTGFYNHAMELLKQIVEKIDLLESQEQNFQQTIHACEELSNLCYISLRDTQKYQAGLYLAELIIFSDENRQARVQQASKLLSDLEKINPQNLDVVRCRARLLGEQGKFEQGARLWAKIAETIEPDTSRWWQAKFFELNFAAKTKRVCDKDIIHSIEVLQASSRSIPNFWAEKLKLLRQRCIADINNS